MSNLNTHVKVGGALGKLARLVKSLEKIGAGAAVDATVARIGSQVASIAQSKVSRHTESGKAASTLSVVKGPRMVGLSSQAYLHFHSWWPFRKGFPLFLIRRTAKVFQEETQKLLKA